jgi:hydroxymethylpyrimidine/phosphomethylpyrimidine kinase
MTTKQVPNVVSIAGIDPSGGAGIFADIKTFSALGAYGCGIVAALTAQNTQAVTGIQAVSTDFIALQMDTLWADVRIDAVKIGMLGAAPVIQTVAERLQKFAPAHLVLDPVMIAKSGDALLEKSAVGALTDMLLPQATLLTPNLPEGAALLAQTAPENVRDMRRMAEKLREKLHTTGRRWVYLKGGHLPGSDCIDLLHDGDVMIEMPGKRIDTKNTHGTGCTLSSALAALLPQVPDVPRAAQAAHDWLARAIARSDELTVGGGHGPVHHFHAAWDAQRERGPFQ